MLFHSHGFLFLFLPVVLCGYFVLGRRGARAASAWIAAASLFFYAYWDVRYLPLLLGSAVWNLALSRRVAASRGGVRRGWLAAGVLGDVVLLGWYKYAGFFARSLDELLHASLPVPEVVLPVGISFFTFTQIGYLVDVYRGTAGRVGALTYLEFVTVFPHLAAGPIISCREVAPQLVAADRARVDYDHLARGLLLLLSGLIKKAAVADAIAPWADAVFSSPAGVTTVEAWLGALAYTLQLYFDFSGYSEMALGLALMLNLRFPLNFDGPYRATSLIEFWRRWHMSLGLWVRDYLYIPLGGNRHGFLRQMGNLLVSMAVIGLWHGAGWTFVLWGVLHGVLLVVNHAWRRLGFSLPEPAGWCLTFLSVLCCWVFFRAADVGSALSVLAAMAGQAALVPAGAPRLPLVTCAGTLAALLVLVCTLPHPARFVPRLPLSRGVLAVFFVGGVYALLAVTQPSEFLYFRF